MSTFSGLEVHGDIIFGENKPDQRTEEEFLAIIQPLLEDPDIAELQWQQYTPYFNDGDACVFGAYFGGHIKFRNESSGGVYAEFPPYDTASMSLLGRRENNYQRETPYTGPNQERYEQLERLRDAIEGGEFDKVLLEKFGDHAEVSVRPGDGIYVEFVDHD